MANGLERYTTEELEAELAKRKGNYKEIHVDGAIKQTCHGCPTVYEFKDLVGDDYYFRLRYGVWHLTNATQEELIAFGEAPSGIDGICSYDEMIAMIEEVGVKLITQ